MSTRCGFCAILGAPNAGKSTLTNALVSVDLPALEIGRAHV